MIAGRAAAWWWGAAWACVMGAAVAWPTAAQEGLAGRELGEVEGARVIVPTSFVSEGASEGDLVFHFHGGARAVCGQIVATDTDAVLVVFSPGGFSSAYRVPFEDADRFGRTLDGALALLKAEGVVAEDGGWGRVAVTSFSAGFGAVRELLKHERYVERIDAIQMADSIYAGYVGDPADRVVNPTQMAGFAAFAERAAAGQKAMVVTHSYIVPPGYAGTHETADYLAEHVDLDFVAVDEEGPGGMRIDRRATAGGLHLIGGAGDDAPAHMLHLTRMGHWLPLLGLSAGSEPADER
ncbi:MAG: hypothetical protein AAF078_05385 [Planctomycetota bacterium]